jgi:parallel beta-helix repeat protein
MKHVTAILCLVALLCATVVYQSAAAAVSITVPINRQTAILLPGDGSVYAITSSPSQGTLSSFDSSTGVVVYTPAPGFLGLDSFAYSVDGSVATVNVLVATATTRIIDTILDASGNPRHGKVSFILTQVVTTPSGIAPAGASVSASLSAAGRFDISVYPSRSLSPQAYYQVWYNDSSGLNRELLGVYDIPASSTAIGLAAYKVTDTNLAARYTFASVASINALTTAVASAALVALLGASPTDGALQKYSASSGGFKDSIISESGTTASVAGNLNVSGSQGVSGNSTVTGNQSAASSSISGNQTVGGNVNAAHFIGDGAGLSGIAGGTGGVTNTGSTTIAADSDVNGVGKISLQTGGVERIGIEADGTIGMAGQVFVKCAGTDDSTALTAAAATAGSNWVVISNTTCAGNDITIANLKIEKGGLLKPVTGHSVTVSTSFSAGPAVQAFTNALAGQGTVTLPVGATVYPQWWGAVARAAVDQTKNDTLSFQAAFDSGAKTIAVPDGHYMIDAVTVASGKTKAGLNLASNTTLNMGENTFLHVKNNASVGYNAIVGWKVSNVIIRGGNLVGDNVTNSRAPDGNPSGYGLALYGATNVWAFNVISQDMFADGFLLAYDDEAGAHPESDNVHLINCTGYRNYRQGATVIGAKNSGIEGGRYYASAGSAPQDGIDIEPNANIHGAGVGSIVSDFVVRGVIATGNTGSGIEVAGANGTVAKVDLLNNHTYTNTGQGIVYRNGNNGRILDNTTYGNTANGLSLYFSQNVILSGNSASGNGQSGIIVQNPSPGGTTQYLTINNNTTNGNVSTGIAIAGASGRTISDVLIGGNTSNGNSGGGIGVDYGVNVKIDGNHVDANSQLTDNTYDGIRLEVCTSSSVINNVIRRGAGAKQQKYGVEVVSGTDTIVWNNDLVISGKTSAISDAATRSEIHGNKLANVALFEVTNSDAFIKLQGTGLILRATDGATCYRVTVNNAGALSTASVTCP